MSKQGRKQAAKKNVLVIARLYVINRTTNLRTLLWKYEQIEIEGINYAI